ncbi:hypothetical protein GCM10010344_76510 [Streptomyces bluensis]|nr:hypothetical protein GCM10010344_76510 [Streptomyces bluensis]
MDGLELGEERGRGDGFVAVVGTFRQPLQEGAADASAVGGVGEEEVLLRVLAGQGSLECGAERDRRDFVDALAAGGAGAREDELADQVRLLGCDDLCDEAAQREAEQVDQVEPEGVDEHGCVVGHVLDRAGCGAA